MKKGFTLIELLAVIVILAVIAVIATPIVLNVIETAKKGALEDSAYSYMSAIEYYVAQTYNDDQIVDYNLNGSIKDISLVSVKGTRATGVNLKLENGKVKSGSISYGDYAIIIVDGKVSDITQAKVSITLLGDSTVNHPIDSTYTDAGATAYDLIDEDITANITTSGTVDTTTLGTYTITYNVENSQGIAASTTRTVNVVDQTKPVITITGDNPLSHLAGDAYTDLGATASDNVDGDITADIQVSSNVVPTIVGNYTVTYSVTDANGNTQSATRTVNVVDTTKPTVTFGTNGASTYAKTNSTTVTITDNAELDTDTFKYQWTNSITTPSEASFTTAFTSGDTISTPTNLNGGYYLWVIAKDSAANTTITKSNVFNLDNTGPVITVSGTNPKTIEIQTSYTDAGATATDAVSGSRTVTSTGTVTISATGTYTITYNASDALGNASSATRTVYVVDTTVPVITVNSNTANFTISVGRKSGTYTPPTGTATDNSAVNPTVTLTSNTVNLATNGTYSVVYSATDGAGNNKTLTMTVNVVDPTYTAYMIASDFTAAGYSTSAALTTSKTQYNITYSNTVTTPTSGSAMSASQNVGCCWGNSLAVGSGGPVYVTNVNYWHKSCDWDDFGYGGWYAWVELLNYDTGGWERVYTRGPFSVDGGTAGEYSGSIGLNGSKRYSQVRIHVDGKHCQEVSVNVTNWNVYSTTTGTTGWQDSSTTGLGTFVSQTTRTVYRYQTN